MLRRSILKFLAAGLAAVIFGPGSGRAQNDAYSPFRHGVASGDPLADRIIIWTRVSVAARASATVDWEVSRDAAFSEIVAAGRVRTDGGRDWTVKHDVRGLEPGQRYFYRFRLDGAVSAVGRTRTLPGGKPDNVRLGVVSCSNFAAGYFYVYRELAARDDLDAVVHLGDYIYEHGPGQYATERAGELGRLPDPMHETVTLDDYRRRYAQYRSDPDARAMHAAHPVIAVWDDHEVANDAWKGGAENHNDDENVPEGDWRDRRDAAVQAYFEWMPIRGRSAGGSTRINREFRFGDLVHLLMLDTRLAGRDQQPDISGTDGSPAEIDAVLQAEGRQMLGRRQERWLRARLRRSHAAWRAIGQQVLVSPMRSPDLEPLIDPEQPSTISPERLAQTVALSKGNPPLLFDTWDGYAWARRRLLADIARYGSDTVVLSGDLHTQLAGNLFADGGDRPVSVEFMAGAVSSPGFSQYLPERAPEMIRDATLSLNPGLRYMDTIHRGWLFMSFTREACVGEWHLVDSVTAPAYTTWIDRRLSVAAGRIGDGLQDA